MRIGHRSGHAAAPAYAGSESADATLVERVELLEAETKALRQERDRLKTDLLIAEAWVAELASWIETSAASRAKLDLDRLLAAAEVRTPPGSWRTLAISSGVLVVPWAAIALIAYLVSIVL